MTNPLDQQAWLQTFRELLHHYLPPLENTPLVNVTAMAGLALGLFLVVRAARYERGIVTVFALFIGAWAGFRVSLLVGTPEPISAAVGAVALAAAAYHTFKWWLAAGSVIVVFFIAVALQLGRGDLQRYLPTPEEAKAAIKEGQISLPSQAEQLRNLHPSRSDQLNKIGDKITEELRRLGPTGWIAPLLAAIAGGVLAWWALRVFAVVWLGLLGAFLAMLSACAFTIAHWPQFHNDLIARPDIAAYTAIGVWLLGLIWQAKEARFPKKKPAEPAKEQAKA